MMRMRTRRTKELVIWVDVIYITQQNTEERNLHIPIIREIYKLAMDMWVWLDPETDNSATAVKEVGGHSDFKFRSSPKMWGRQDFPGGPKMIWLG
jgi:hypothetical protein